MREKLEFSQKTDQEKQVEKDENVFMESARIELERIFDENLNEKEREQALLDQFALISDNEEIGKVLGEERLREIQENLIQCCKIKDKDEFVKKSIEVLQPLLDLRKNNPQIYEGIVRKKTVEQENFIPVDGKNIFSYGVDDGILHFHLGSAKTIEPSILMRFFREALDKFAQIVEQDQSIKVIQGTSEIVSRFAKILERRYGFIIEGEIDKETREKYFPLSEGKVHKASMSREEFLKRYSREKAEH